MSTDLTIPTSNLPANFLNPNAMADNADLMSGISLGMPPQIGLKGTRFVLKTDAGDQVIDSTKIDLVILKGRKGLTKSWYATKYDPNQSETRMPDCFSNHGDKPEPGCSFKQAESCAGCEKNQFGTGTAADGTASKGKACSDNKIMAVFYAGQIYSLKVPPNSLRSMGDYVNTLLKHQLDPHKVKTTVGFNPAYDYAVLTFEYAGVLPQAAVTKLEEFMAGSDVADIVAPRTYNVTAPATPATPQIPAPAAKPADPIASKQEADLGSLGLPGEAAAPAKEKTKATKPTVVPPPTQQASEVVVETTATVVDEDDDAAALAALGLKK